MPMRTMTTFAIAVALGAAWTVAPALAQTTSEKVENKAERAADKIENKAERAGDKIENKAERAKDKVDGKDTVGDKVDRTVDKTKEKSRELKDKVVDKTKETKDKVVEKTDKLADKADRATVRTHQQSLKDKGYDPGPIDGIHGPRTSAAVREYQKKEGLTVSGRFDDDTMGRLSGTGTVRTGSDGTAPASPSASPATGSAPASPQIPAKQSR